MKFAVHILAFNQDKWILRTIENCGPYVDIIYIMYSKIPWSYNKDARKYYQNDFDLKTLESSRFFKKIMVINGEWNKEEDERNAALNQAEKDQIDFLIIQDADEFYFNQDYQDMIEYVKKNPQFDCYKTPWKCFWKSWNYVLVDSNENDIIGYPDVIIKVNSNLKFSRCRIPNSNRSHKMNFICYHGSYILTDAECSEKINTWGHANEVKQNWFQNKWLNWTPETTLLHPVNPPVWNRAKKFTDNLPEVLSDNR